MYFFYLLTTAFQLSASLLLLNNIRIDFNTVVNTVFQGHRTIIVDNNNDIKNSIEFKETANKLWINRIAFILLSFGYLLSPLADNESQHHVVTILLIAVITIVLYVVANQIAKYKSRKYNKINISNVHLPESAIIVVDNEDKTN